MAIDQESRERAEDLYIIDGLTLEEVAKAADINIRTLQNWSVEGNWPKRRKERLQRKRLLKDKLEILREKSIDKAIETGDPQAILAAYKIEELADRKSRKEMESVVPDIDRPRLFLEDMEFVAETLKEIDPEGLRILAKNFDVIVGRFKEQYANPSTSSGTALQRA